MFSVDEKRKIAAAVEKVLLDLKHPEMPTERPEFVLGVLGKENWSYADIRPNWTIDEATARATANPWNERRAYEPDAMDLRDQEMQERHFKKGGGRS